LVSDGLSGCAGGALAAKIIARDMPFLVNSKLKYLKTCSIEATNSILTKTIIELGSNMRSESMKVFDAAGMGATLVMALLRKNRAFIANVGDSRAYLFRRGKLSQLSETTLS